MHDSKIKNKKILPLAVVMTAAAILVAPGVLADSFDQQINNLQQQNGQLQNSKDHLNIEAITISGKVASLQAEIDSLESDVAKNETKYDGLTLRMNEAETELVAQRKILGAVILEMHHADQLSTIEMLATSKNLSDYVDQQAYRNAVSQKVKNTLDKVTTLKRQIQKQKITLEKLLVDQQNMRAQLDKEKTQVDTLLAYNIDQQNSYQQQVRQNNASIAELRRQQAALNASLYVSGTAPAGIPGGGGYPAKWANAPMDSIIDSWGMYNRECVSYTAWKVASSGRYMPYWGGYGNAKQWPDNARDAGIPVDYTPRKGDVAISTRGTYGHSMYVEDVSPDGQMITVSQYNAAWDGNYSVAKVSVAGLQFIHF